MKKIADFIVEHSLFLVILFFVFCIPAGIGYVLTNINYDILVYLPSDLETVEGQEILTRDFGIGAFSFVMTDNLSNKEILALEKRISKIDGVEKVLSLADSLGSAIPTFMVPDALLDKLYHDDSTIIVVTFKNSTSDALTIKALDELRKVANDASSVSSMTALVLDTMNVSNREMLIYIILAVLLVSFVLFFATDSYIVPLFLLGNIGVAILYNMGSNVFLGNISYITQAITAVLQLGVTMDFSIFLYHKYEEKKKIESDIKRAMSLAIVETFSSVIGSSLTTIAGFLALCGMNLTLGKDIGIVMAKGVLCGLVCVLVLFPCLLLVFDSLIEKTKHKVYFPKFSFLCKLSTKYIAPILILAFFVAVISIYGNQRVEVYYKLDESLPEDLPCRVANSRLAKEFNIVSPEIVILNKDIPAKQILKLSEELKKIDGIDLVLSAANISEMGIPSSMLPEDLNKIFESNKYQIIILNSSYEVASDELSEQIDLLKKIVKRYDEKAILAGEGALTKDLVEIANHDFMTVNYISIGVIFVIMLVVLKSVSLPFILVLVIELSIFINMACSYFMGVKLPFIASIVVGTIQLGATIDYAILLSNTYLENRKKERDKRKAMESTLDTTIPSIVLSALCFFAATFGVAIYSKIDMISSICNLLSRGALISMMVVSLLLPALLLSLDKFILKTTKMKERI